MRIKKIGKKIGRRFCAMALACSIVLSGFAGDGQIVFAKTDDEVVVAEQDNAEANSQTKIPYLIEDEEETGVYYNSNSEMRDFRDETIYFVMTTRFYDGDSSNNVQCWDGKDKNGESDPPWRGDFKGLIEKLDYIKALGFTAIWITPVVKNASGYDYHGYHAINFMEVDSRYESGDECTYQDLIDAVHARDMKIIQDVVFNHTGNWGEENLYPMFTKDENADLSDVSSCMKRNMDMAWDPNYDTFMPESDRGRQQLRDRLKLMNADSDAGTKYDTEDIYHHNGFVGSSFEQPIVQYGSIHYADCMDLNTENPKVYKYLVDAYTKYINMGVDAFRVDTTKHISRLTLNNAFNQQLNDAYNKAHGLTGEGNFFMFGEVCTRFRNVWNDNKPAISTPFYTWKETKEYAWDDSETAAAVETNCASARQHLQDNFNNVSEQPTSTNAFLQGNEYHTPDYSQASGMNVIDFPMHWAFKKASEAYQQALAEDSYYNDSTFNVTYVDSHDYGPDGIEKVRYNGSTEDWAENLSLIFTFRGIPCIYYGSEVEFKKGEIIDEGASRALEDSGRAYFGDYLEGSVDVVDFGRYTNATGAMKDTLNNKLSLHIQRLNRLRAAIPALRKGQYSTDGCSGQFAYKRRYTDDKTDSFAVIALSSDASFTGIPNGKYKDAITGDVKNVTDGKLSTSGIKGQGDLRVYVLDTEKTPAPDMIDGYSDFMSGGCDLIIDIEDPTAVTLDKTSAELDLGDVATFKVTVEPAKASQNVTWTSSDNTVATVSGGKVTAKGEGTTTITATTKNGLKATATVKVEAKGVKVDAVTLNKSSESLDAGQTLQLVATVTPANADPKYAALTWKSSDAKIASVDQSGLITAVKKGTATITAETASGKSATMEVTVNGTIIYGNAIRFEKPSGWGNNINVYFWEEGGSKWSNAAWPGVAMEEIDTGVYALEWPEGKEDAELGVVFNDGTNKTGDLEAIINGYYNKNGLVKIVDPIDRPIETITVSLANDTVKYTYNGQEQKPEVVVKEGNKKLVENTDYTVTYKNNINAGANTAGANAPSIIVKGKGDYETKIDKIILFTIAKADMPANAPTDRIVDANTKLSEISLGNDWTWSDKDKDKQVAAEQTLSVTAVYNGADKDNYQNLTVTVVVTGSKESCAHSKTEIRDSKEATCTEKGYTGDTYCKECGTFMHAGEAIQAAGHKWDNGKVTKEPTETAQGIKQYECTVCGKTKTEVIPKTTHQHTWDAGTITKEATVTAEGEITYNCTGCTATKTESIPKLTGCQHTWDAGKVTTEPTVKEPGIKTYTCVICGETKTESIPVLICTHEWNAGQITKEPTLTEEGEKTYTCTVCDATKVEKLSKKTCTHNWGNGVVTKEPTETAEGEKTYTCTICSETKKESIPATGKKPAEPSEPSGPATPTTGPGVIDTQGKTVEEGDTVKDKADKVTYRITNSDKNKKTVEYIVTGSKEKEVTVPDEIFINDEKYKVTSVAENAFKNKKTVEEVVLGENVKTIEDNAFSGCKNLKKVSMNGTVTEIGNKAFYKCTSLTSIEIPSKVNKIGKQAFYGCKNLKNITIRTNKLTDKKVGSNAFKGISSKATIKVPKSKLSQYKKLLKKKGVSAKATIKK